MVRIQPFRGRVRGSPDCSAFLGRDGYRAGSGGQGDLTARGQKKLPREGDLSAWGQKKLPLEGDLSGPRPEEIATRRRPNGLGPEEIAIRRGPVGPEARRNCHAKATYRPGITSMSLAKVSYPTSEPSTRNDRLSTPCRIFHHRTFSLAEEPAESPTGPGSGPLSPVRGGEGWGEGAKSEAFGEPGARARARPASLWAFSRDILTP